MIFGWGSPPPPDFQPARFYFILGDWRLVIGRNRNKINNKMIFPPPRPPDSHDLSYPNERLPASVAVVASPSSRRRRRVAVVASPSSPSSRRLSSCKNQNSKFGRGCGQILNFDFCGVGSQSVGRSRRVAVVAVRAARAAAFFLAKFKIQNLAADAAKF